MTSSVFLLFQFNLSQDSEVYFLKPLILFRSIVPHYKAHSSESYFFLIVTLWRNDLVFLIMSLEQYEKAWVMIDDPAPKPRSSNSDEKPTTTDNAVSQDQASGSGVAQSGDNTTKDGLNEPNNPVEDIKKEDLEEEVPRHSSVVKIMDIVEMKTDTGENITTRARRLRKITGKTKFEGYSCILRRQITQAGMPLSANLEINSPYLRDVFKKILADFDRINLDGDVIKIPKPYEPLFYREDEMRALRGTVESGPAQRELDLVLGFLDLHLSQTRKEFNRLVSNGKITSELAWALFPPNEIAFVNASGSNPPQCWKVHYCSKAGNSLSLRFSVVSWNGKKFGNVRRQINIPLPVNAGTFPITDLVVYPIKFHPRKNEIREELIKRGRKYVKIVRRAHMTYNGVIWVEDPIDHSLLQRHVSSRVMIDYAEYVRNNPRSAVTLEGDFGLDITDDFFPCSCGDSDCKLAQKEKDREEKKQESAIRKDDDERKELDDDEVLLCPAFVQGFALRDKVWAEFRIDHLKNVEWNAMAYERLELDDKVKRIIRALVQAHRKHSIENPPDFDDIIAGKGLGLVFLLQGQPGLGKTLTAGALNCV